MIYLNCFFKQIHNIIKFLFILGIFTSTSYTANNYNYSVPETPWPNHFGNHRAVIEVDNPAELIKLDFKWRRHDRFPENKRFIILNSETNDTIKYIHRIAVNNEDCKIVFGPVKYSGTYYFYYMPYEIQENFGGYIKDYLIPEKSSTEWSKNQKLNDKNVINNLPSARLVSVQSRTSFDSFFPMEIIATKEEKNTFFKSNTKDFIIFPESRENPIRMKDELPKKWIERGLLNEFEGDVLKNEYYVFQLGVYALKKEIENLKLEFSGIRYNNNIINSDGFTCFNLGGIDPFGNKFEKKINVKKGNIQALWIGIDIPENIEHGKYTGTVSIKADKGEPQIIDLSFNILDQTISDRGDSETWRHSRLRWLNSALGINDSPTDSYSPIISLDERTYELSGKQLQFEENGLPSSLKVYGSEILSKPIKFVVESQEENLEFQTPNEINLRDESAGVISSTWKNSTENMELIGKRIIESDGYLRYKFSLKAEQDINLKDVRLEIPMNNEVSQYMMGMGLEGGQVPTFHNAGWDGPHDSFWIGNHKGGLWCELRGSSYHGPLLNVYRPEYPKSWHNNKKGGFKIIKGEKYTNVIIYSGDRNLRQGESIDYEWAFLLTPVKKINYNSQFIDRYYHRGDKPQPTDNDFKAGVKIINVHHANVYNPYINYPFIAVDEMKKFVDEMHSKEQKVKIYYTVRELTNYTTEIWALRSLGNEILADGAGGGYPWLREHFVDGYQPQWYNYFTDKSADASILTASGDSRWYNYYVEGLAWLVRNVDIDGLYLDDVSYDRRIIKRIRKVLDKEKPGCLIDLHSNTGYSKGPATQYAEYFPYINKLWFGESFQYDKMSFANWFVEVSGIPFGLMGDMLQGGGNRWLGMLFGMTVRHPWHTEGALCDPRPVWEVWDEFGIHEAEMIGFWEDSTLVTINNPNVKATIYKKVGQSLIALGNFSDKVQKIKLDLNWQELGLEKSKVKLIAPEIKDYQAKSQFEVYDEIVIQPRRGWLFFVGEYFN